MKITRRIYMVLALAVLAGPVTGCVAYGPRPGVLYVGVRPPVERVEVIPAAPGVGFVWIKGYYAYRGGEYAWEPGRWERPAEGRTAWVPHHWEHDSHGWYLVEGHWR
jgi:hypothetical protein